MGGALTPSGAAYALSHAIAGLIGRAVRVEYSADHDGYVLVCNGWRMLLTRQWLEQSDRDQLARLASKVAVNIEEGQMNMANYGLGGIVGGLFGTGASNNTAGSGNMGGSFVDWNQYQQRLMQAPRVQQAQPAPEPKPLTNRQWLQQRVDEIRVRL